MAVGGRVPESRKAGFFEALEMKMDEIDALPEFDDIWEEIDNLPEMDDVADEIDNLPDMDDFKESGEKFIDKSHFLFRKIDEMFQSGESDSKNRVERVNRVKDIVRYSNPVEMVKTVAYFSYFNIPIGVNLMYNTAARYSKIDLDKTVVNDIKDIYNDVITPQYIKDHFDNTILNSEYVVDEMTDITCKISEAELLIASSVLLSVAKPLEQAVEWVAGTIAHAAGNLEKAEEMHKADIIGATLERMRDNYDGTEFVKEISACIEKVGPVATYLGLSVLIGGAEGAAAAVAAATAVLGAAHAEEGTRRAIEKTGEYTYKEWACGLTTGILEVLAVNVADGIGEGMKKVVAPEIKSALDGGLAGAHKYIAEKIAVAAENGAISGLDTLVFGMKDVVNQYVEKALEIRDEVDVDWEHIAKNGIFGVLVGGTLSLATDFAKDIQERVKIDEKEIVRSIGTSEGIKALIEKHPEKAELWQSQLEALDILNAPDASPAEIRSAQAKLSILKGQLLETAVKDTLIDAGFDVELQQRVVKGERGGTRPDVIAKNNTDCPKEVFGITIQSGETLCAECKCGGSSYMTNQLNNHIPNQLSGQEGTKVLLTTSDIKDTPSGLANSICEKYGAKLVIPDVSVSDVENAIKEVANE